MSTEAIRNHVAQLFSAAPKSRRAVELQEELISNLQERYDDLINQGNNSDVAYKTVIEGIGDVSELLRAVKEPDVLDTVWERQQRKKSALLTSFAVGLYICSPIALIVGAVYEGDGILGLCALLILCAVATGLLVYNYYTKPRYTPTDDTIVEEFKEYSQGKNKTKALQNAINSLIWSIATVIFLAMGLFGRLWNVAWLVFLLAVAAGQIVRLIFVYREENK